MWREADVLITPATPISAPKIGETAVEVGDRQEEVRLASTRLTRGFNVLGLPAISIPCGKDAAGLPLGMQIVAPAFEEARLLRVAAAMESALGFQSEARP